MRWFRRWLRTLLSESVEDLDRALQTHLLHVKQLRVLLVEVLEEVEAATAACDVLEARIGQARQHMTEQKAARLEPAVLTMDNRSR